MGRHNVDHRESDSESEIAVSGGHAPQPEAKKIKSCACSVACMPLCNVSIGEGQLLHGVAKYKLATGVRSRYDALL